MIVLCERLQSGDVCAECEPAIAHGQRRINVEFTDDRIMPRDERVPVNRSHVPSRECTHHTDKPQSQSRGKRAAVHRATDCELT